MLIKEQNKKSVFSANWLGPYVVTNVHDNENITIKKGRKDYRLNINNVKKYYETDL